MKILISGIFGFTFYPLVLFSADFADFNRPLLSSGGSLPYSYQSSLHEHFEDQRIKFFSKKGYTDGGTAIYRYVEIKPTHEKTPKGIEAGNVNIGKNSRVQSVFIRVKAEGILNARQKIDIGNLDCSNHAIKNISIKVNALSVNARK